MMTIAEAALVNRLGSEPHPWPIQGAKKSKEKNKIKIHLVKNSRERNKITITGREIK
jgi:hypothetical protein